MSNQASTMLQTRLPRLSCTERAYPKEVGNGWRVCGDVKVVGFSIQNVYKMTNGDTSTISEPLNP